MASAAHHHRGLKCTTCGRLVPPHARYCRACYTIVRDENNNTERYSKLATALKLLTAITVAWSGVWFYQSNLGHEGSSTGNVLEDWLRNGTVTVGRPKTVASTQRTGSSSGGTSNKVRHENPVRHLGKCNLKQTIENRTRVPVSNVPLLVKFEDSAGNIVAERQLTEAKTSLGPGESRVVALELPCPDSVAAADVSVSPIGGASDSNGKAGVVLLDNASRARPHTARARSGKRYILAKEMADLSFCPPPGDCRLGVQFENGQISDYTFRRSPVDPAQLTSSDQIVVGYLLANDPAYLSVTNPKGEKVISFSSDDLVESDPGNPVINWFDDFLG